jgi:serine/alanine adding enzyme
MSNDMEVLLCGDNDKLEWDSFVESMSDGTISHLYGWRRIIAAAYNHKSYYLIARRNGKIHGVLPLVWVKSLVFGNSIASMPFQDYGGILSDDRDAERILLQRALSLKQELRADCLELRHLNTVPADRGKIRRNKVTLTLDLSMGSEKLWKTFSGKLRNQIRKAEKCGLQTAVGGIELLNEFYPVFAANMRDLGSPVHSFNFFIQVFSEFGDKARLLVALDNGKTIGGLLVLFFKNAAIVPWASSLRECFSKCPNNILYWNILQDACSRGCTVFDFGRSTIGSGTYNFKLQWGAKPIPLNWQLFDNTDTPEIESISEDPKYKMAAAVWKHLPLAFTTYVGPVIRKYLVN